MYLFPDDDLVSLMEYEVVDFVGAGLIMVVSQFGRQIWVECVKRLNTHKNCEMCGEDQFQLITYRPVSNPKNRGHRIYLKCVKEKMIVKPEMMEVVR